jgi:cytochrome c-type biogenesis protein
MGIEVGILAALLGGLLSFLSPCVLPLVPPYLCYLAGTTLDELASADKPPIVQRRVMVSALLFVAGFTTVFVALGATASIVAELLRLPVSFFGLIRPTPLLLILGQVAGVVIILMGLHFLGLFRIAFLYREARFQSRSPAGPLGAYVMGLAFAFGWTPCIGPVLAAILTIAGSGDTVWKGAALLAVYSAGLGIPFLIAAFAVKPFLAASAGFRQHLPKVEKAMGGLLVLTGIAFLTGAMSQMAFWLLETFPVLGTIG